MDEVDILVANDNYVQAKALLEQMLFDDLPAPVHETVKRSMDNLLFAEMKYLEAQQAIRDKAHSAQWDQAIVLLDSQKYDAAIKAFEELLNTEYDIPARSNMMKAAESAASEMRRKSASIFVKARRERDDDRKKELFRESWQILQEIMTKYPEVQLIDKVRQNLAIIEKHIELFDPSVLPDHNDVVGGDVEDPL